MSWQGSGPGDVEPTVQKTLNLELVVTSAAAAGRSIPVLPGRFSIGSDKTCDVVLNVATVLGHHAEGNHTEDGALWIRGLQAGTTFVNGVVAAAWSLITPGSYLKLGDCELVLRERGSGSSPYGTLKAPTPLRSPPGTQSGVQARAAEVAGTHVRQSGTQSRPLTPLPLDTPVTPSGRQRALYLEPGTLVADRYRVISKLAAGGMGEVYKAEHVELGRIFALKVMRPELSADPEFVERFKREAVASGRIGHQNIVDITDFGRTADGRFYFVMEFLDGRTLASIVGREGAQPLARVLHITVQMLRALGAAHKIGIVHRDLKPENVMVLQRDGQADLVKVVDFGVAKVNSGHGAGGQTAIGMVVGTPQYMAPEQAAGLAVDTRSDIYSLGLIVYELITGRPVFKGETPSILMAMHMTQAAPSMEGGPLTWPLPAKLEALVFQMLSKKGNDRPQTTDQVLHVVEDVQRELTGSGRFTGVVAAPRRTGVNPVSSTQQVMGLSGLQPAVVSTSPSGTVRPPSGTNRPPSGARPITGTQPLSGIQSVQRSRAPMVAVALTVVAVLGLAGVLFSREPAAATPREQLVMPPPAPAVAPPPLEEPKPELPSTAKVVVIAYPEKAAVYDDGVFVGTTPLPMTREVGSSLTLKLQAKGFKEATTTVAFSPDVPTVEVRLEREKPAPAPAGVRKKKKDLLDDPYASENDLKDLPDQ